MKAYAKYYGTKIIWYLVTFIFALILNFLLPRLMPGNPVDALIAEATAGITDGATVDRMVQEYTEQFGLDKSLPEQFFVYVGNLLQGDMGTSFQFYPREVSDVIGESIVWTIGLQIPAIIVGWVLGNALGALAAYLKGAMDKTIMPIFMFISNIPAFGLAFVMLWFFSYSSGLLPSSGGYAFDLIPNMSWEFVSSVILHYQLPFWTVVLITIGGQAIGMRSMAIYELNSDYVKYSRFLGIKDRKIVKYVFRNAMLPQISGLAMMLGTMIGGNLVAEMVFNYPGLGTTLFNAINGRDYPLLSACTLMITIMVLLANLTIEILLAVVDPRIKAAQSDS